MNYPVWDVSFGAGLLIALVAILHVFVSHFAVGGGLFLVLTEIKARRANDSALRNWLRSHTRFFVLLTVVYGAISGVGIWFTIALISPTATSNLIHIYVWGWAIEWVFFFLEITAALLYYYGWEKLPAKLHEWYGWIYFIAAYLSLVVINGIIAFMLTSGKWIESRQFWSGFFNPTYFPSLLFRSAICFALAGIYALITASLLKDQELKARIVRWAAWFTIPSLVLLPVCGWWYIRKIPADVWSNARGAMPTGTQYAFFAVVLLAVTAVLFLITVFWPRRMHIAFSLLVALVALGAMGSFEFVREAIRKPFVISNYLYANSLYLNAAPGDGGFNIKAVGDVGVLKSAKWIEHHEITPENQLTVGHEIFRVECQSCHTPDAYRGIKHYLILRQWDRAKVQAMLGGLDAMHNGVMPPFAGTDAEREALAVYISSIEPIGPGASPAADGKTVYERNCIMCHQVKPTDQLYTNLAKEPKTAIDALKDLPSLFPLMPDLKLSEQERTMLVEYINQHRDINAANAPAQGGK